MWLRGWWCRVLMLQYDCLWPTNWKCICSYGAYRKNIFWKHGRLRIENLRVFQAAVPCESGQNTLTLAVDIDGTLPKGPYPPWLCMADRALLAGYPRYTLFHSMGVSLCRTNKVSVIMRCAKTHLKNWNRSKMATILQTPINFCTKYSVFWFKLHWRLLLRVRFIVLNNWFILASNKRESDYMKQWHLSLRSICAPPGLNYLTHRDPVMFSHLLWGCMKLESLCMEE